MELNLITSIGWDVKEKFWIEHLRQKNISKVIIIRLVEDYDPQFTDDITKITKYVSGLVKNQIIPKKDGEGITKASETLHKALEILERLYIPYEYYEIAKKNSKISIISFLLSIIIKQEENTVIDFSRGERLFIPLFLTIANLIPEKIKEFASLDFRNEFYHTFPFYLINFDPDKRTSTTIKEILSFFLPPQAKFFKDIPNSVFLRSKDIEQKLPDLNPTHLKTRLQFISTNLSGRPSLIDFELSKEDKRIYLYYLSENGLFLLYVNYLRYKYIKNNTEEPEWYVKCINIFNTIEFNDTKRVKQFVP